MSAQRSTKLLNQFFKKLITKESKRRDSNSEIDSLVGHLSNNSDGANDLNNLDLFDQAVVDEALEEIKQQIQEED